MEPWLMTALPQEITHPAILHREFRDAEPILGLVRHDGLGLVAT